MALDGNNPNQLQLTRSVKAIIFDLNQCRWRQFLLLLQCVNVSLTQQVWPSAILVTDKGLGVSTKSIRSLQVTFDWSPFRPIYTLSRLDSFLILKFKSIFHLSVLYLRHEVFISRVFDETLVIFVFASQLLCTVYFVCVQYGQILLQLPRAFAFHRLCLPLDRFNCTNIFTKQNKLFEQLYRNIWPAQLATLDSSTSYIYRLDYVYLNSSVGESLIQNKFWKD